MNQNLNRTSSFEEQGGYGRGKFVLGHGANGTAGHVEIRLRTLSESGEFRVEWDVQDKSTPVEVQKRVVDAAKSYLRGYVLTHPKFGLAATIVEVTSDESRVNEYERAVYLALYAALEDAALPLPQIYAAPNDDETWDG